jgi:hypothetical protein
VAERWSERASGGARSVTHRYDEPTIVTLCGGWSVACLGYRGVPCSASDEAAQGYEGMQKHSEGPTLLESEKRDRNVVRRRRVRSERLQWPHTGRMGPTDSC